MGMPLITKDEIIAYLLERVPQDPRMEISGIYPMDDSIIKYGIYVRDVNTMSRESNQLGVTYGGSIYTDIDAFEIVYVSYQYDPQNVETRTIIENMSAHDNFFDGYHEVDFTKNVQIGNRSEKYTYNYSMKRLDFNDTATT